MKIKINGEEIQEVKAWNLDEKESNVPDWVAILIVLAGWAIMHGIYVL